MAARAYPDPPASDSQVERIRYRAQVAEIRAIRTEELKPDSARKGYDEWWALAAFVCAAAALVLPRLAMWIRGEDASGVKKKPGNEIA